MRSRIRWSTKNTDGGERIVVFGRSHRVPLQQRRRSSLRPLGSLVAICMSATLLATPTSGADPARGIDPIAEAQNLLKWGERTGSTLATLDPNFYRGVAEKTIDYQRDRRSALGEDPERQVDPNSCTLVLLCAINPELVPARWRAQGGTVEPVLYTSRSGATISGSVWAWGDSTAKRPGVVITNGSILGYEQAYWYLSQYLARAGYVVLTYDAQGEGMSDQFGEAPDQLEAAFAGTMVLGLFGPQSVTGSIINGTHRPVGDGLGLGGNGLPFIDGQTDAIDFFTSTPSAEFTPRPSRSTGTSHDAKQQRRADAGLNNSYNPLWNLLDTNAIGVTGHSYGAIAASWSGQDDPRVDAIVALDSLCVPGPPLDEVVAFSTAAVNNIGPVTLPAGYGFSEKCFGTPTGPIPAITKPGLLITGDYLVAPVPYVVPPDPLVKSRASFSYSESGVDTGAIILRGANHMEYNETVGLLPTTLRGQEMSSWYTRMWFDKYLRAEASADAQLMNPPWTDDAATRAVDPSGDSNMYSYHYRSRMDIGLSDGHRFRCEDLRSRCN